MARRGILDYVLGGAVGGLEGLAQQRAAEDEKKRMADAANRQAMLDQIALVEKGFVERGARQDRTKAAAPAIGAMVNTALSSVGVGGGPVGMLPDLSAVEKTAGMYGTTPAQSFTVGGKTYDQMQTTQEQTVMEREQEAQRKAEEARVAAKTRSDELSRVAAEKATQLQQMTESLVAAGVPLAKARAAAQMGAKYGDLFMSEKDMKSLGIDQQKLALAQAEFAYKKANPSSGTTVPQRFGGDYTQTLDKIADFLPTTDPKTGALVAPKRPLSAQKSFLVQEGSPERGFTGRLGLIGASTLGYDTSEEQLYNTLAKEVATAYAMKEQQGRNVSNADLLNRQSQITVQPNEIGNLEIQKVKGDRLKQWAKLLQSGAPIPQVNPGETIVPPTLNEARESLRDNGFSEAEIDAYFAKKGGGR
jgi:hypothetical protein